MKQIDNLSVDVILPNYNKEKFVKEAIDSVLSQTSKNWHLYIIDDFSKDNSYSIVSNFKKIYENIKIINNKKNLGPGLSRNKALNILKGKYILFLDSDDFLIDKAIDLNPNIALAYARRGSIYYKLGDLQRATMNWNIALKLDPEFEEIQELLLAYKEERLNSTQLKD